MNATRAVGTQNVIAQGINLRRQAVGGILAMSVGFPIGSSDFEGDRDWR